MVRSLSFHASYRCRQRGVCCSSGWPIPIEADRLARLTAAAATGRLRLATGVAVTTPLVRALDPVPGAPAAVLSIDHGRCVFYDRGATGGCVVHEALGHDALPLACRQFPRVSVRDPRGVSVTLSHYCPTAASLLEASVDGPPGLGIRIVTDAPAFPHDAEYVGLDATGSLPPLLRPGLLMDWDGWWQLEAEAIAWLDRAPSTAHDALAGLRIAVDHIRLWRPGGTPLAERIAAVFADLRPVTAPAPTDEQTHRAVTRALTAIPPDLRPSPPPRPYRSASIAEPIRLRFLAAHTFASWAPHTADGLDAWLTALDTALGLLDAGLDVGEADLWRRHLGEM